MLNTKILILILIIIVGITIAIKTRPINLEKIDKRILFFNDLPENVKSIYFSSIDNKIEHNKTISLDKEYKIIHKHTGIDNGLLVLFLRGFNHHFYINNKHFKLSANKGFPFILSDKLFYYSKELSMRNSNINDIEFVEINLINYLD